MPSSLHRQAGIAIGPILFIIAILGLLAAAIAAGSGSFSGGTTQESSRINATAVIENAQSIADAVQILTGRGYDDTQINLNTPQMGYYSNPSAPADGSCDVFNVTGGNVVMVGLPTAALDPQPAYPGSQFWRWPMFTGKKMMTLGTGAPALIAFYPYIKREVCIAINDRLGVTNPSGTPYQVTGTCATAQGFFTGSYQDSGVTWCGIPNTPAACVYDPAGIYYFYKALIVR